MATLHERQSRRFPAVRTIEGSIGNRVAPSILDPRERMRGLISELLEEHLAEEQLLQDDVSGHILQPTTKLSTTSTPEFNQIYSYIANRVDRFEPRALRGKARGYLFAHLARHEMIDRVKPELVVTTEQETFDFFKKAAKLKTQQDKEGIEYAKNIYIPEGLVINQTIDGPTVLAMLEYSSHFDFFKFNSQVHGFRCARNSLGLSRATDFIIVVPGGISDEDRDQFRTNLTVMSGLQDDEKKHILVQTTSFTQEEFNRYSNYVIYNYSSDHLRVGNVPAPTLDEMSRDRRISPIDLPPQQPTSERKKIVERGGVIEFEVVDGLKRIKRPPVKLFVVKKQVSANFAKIA